MIAWLFSCSFMLPKVEPCNSTSQCELTFGMGYTCGDEGYCDLFTPNPRCQKTVPEDYYDMIHKYDGAYIVGTLFKHGTDQANLVAASLALEEARGLPLDGVNDFVMIHCDYEVQDEEGEERTTEVVRELSRYLDEEVGASLIIGPPGSGSATTSFNATTDTLIISPSATSTTLSTIDGEIKSNDNPGRFWRTVASDALQASALASFVQDRSSNIAILYENDVYGSDFVAIMEETFSGNINTTRYAYQPGDMDMAEAKRQEIGLNGHDAVVFLTSEITDITNLIPNIASDDNYRNQTLFFADATADTRFFESTPALMGTGIQVFGTRPPLQDGALFNNFNTLFELKADDMGYEDLSVESDVYAAYTYDATWIGIYGYAWAHFQGNPMSYHSLARGLREISDPEAIDIDITSSSWNTIQAKFREGESVNVQGTSGPLDFNPLTEELESTIEIWALSIGYDCATAIQECDTQLNCSEVVSDSTCETEDGGSQFQGPFEFTIMNPPAWSCSGNVEVTRYGDSFTGVYNCSDGEKSYTDYFSGLLDGAGGISGSTEIKVWDAENMMFEWSGAFTGEEFTVFNNSTFSFEGVVYDYSLSVTAREQR